MDDAELVDRARGGDRSAWAAIYDRYADRLHDHCWSILRDEHEAADALHDAFVNAAGAIGQLRDPSRLRPWLYAIARNEAFRRHRRRKRAVPTDFDGPTAPAVSTVDVTEDGGGGDQDLQQLVWDAAGGLSIDDQAILDLHLRQGLEGQDLADALGITANNAYVKLHRLRETLERSLGALLVARTGSDECEELQKLTAGWDGTLSPLLRKRIARHVDGCEICGERKRRMVSPMALLAGVPLVPAPALLRERTLDDAVAASSSSGPRRRRGGPRRRGGLLLVSAAAIAVVAVVVALLAGDRGEPEVVAAVGDESTTTTTAIGSTTSTTDEDATSATSGTTADTAATTFVPGDTTPGTAPAAGPGPTDPPVVAPPPGPSTTTSTTSTTAPAAPGTIALDTTALAFGDTATTRTFTVRNGGGRPIDVTASGSIAALSMAPAATTLGPGESASITVGLDRSSLPEGSVTGRVRVAGSEAGTQLAADVDVTGTVRRPPTVGVPTLSKTTFQNACNTSNSTSTVTVSASDDSGIASIVLHWSGPGGAGSKPIRTSGSGVLGPFPSGTFGDGQAWVVVTDVHGNATTSGTTSFTVEPCPS